MALPVSSSSKARPSGLVVVSFRIADLQPGTALDLFKPNALNGFYAHSTFLPELSGLRWGLTAGPNPQKEWVSAHRAYADLLRPHAVCTVKYLPWNPRYTP